MKTKSIRSCFLALLALVAITSATPAFAFGGDDAGCIPDKGTKPHQYPVRYEPAPMF